MGKANKERLGAAFPGDCCGRAWVPPACFGAGGTEGTLQGSGHPMDQDPVFGAGDK